MSLVGLLIAVALIVGTLVALVSVINFSLSYSLTRKQAAQALSLAQQAIEGVRNFRDNTDWSINGLGTLALGSPYYLTESGLPPVWTLVPGQKTEQGFTQGITFYQAERDANHNLVEGGGTADAGTRKVKVEISWQEKGKDRRIEISSYLTNW